MKKTVLLLTIFSSLAFAVTMTIKNYQCNKCWLVIESEDRPNATTCPISSTHTWDNLGEVGEKNYQCNKCGMHVKSKDRPYATTCKVSSTHTWNNL